MRWIRRLRVVPCLAEMTQQIHSFRASGVRSFQAARVAGSKLRALRISPGVLCTGPGLVSFFAITLSRLPTACGVPVHTTSPRQILAGLHGLLEG